MGLFWTTRRTQHWARVSAKEARKQTRIMQDQMRRDSLAQMKQQRSAAPGWYRNEADSPNVLRWWDGAAWTAHTQQAPPPPS